MTQHVERPGIVLADVKHLKSAAGINSPGVMFRHEITAEGQASFTHIDGSLINLCSAQAASVLADADVLFDQFHPKDVANFKRALADAVRDRANQRFEARIVTRDGEERWLHGYCWPRQGEGGTVICDGLLIDVVDRKKQEQRERTIVEAMPIPAVISRERDGHIFYANDLYLNLVGMKADDPDRSTRMHYVDLSEREKMVEVLHRDGIHTNFELQVKKPDGSEMIAITSAQLMEFDGELAIFGSLYDITDTRRAEQEIRASERRLQDFAEAASDWLWETDEEHRYTALYIGGGAYPGDEGEVVGRGRLDVIGRHLQADDPDKWKAHKKTIADRKSFRDLIYGIDHPDGRRSHIRTSGMPIHDETGTFIGYRGTGTDITDEVEAERNATTARERLAAAIDSLSNWVAMCDADDRLVQANKAWWRANERAGVEPKIGMPYEDYLRMLIDADTFPDAKGRGETWIAERIKRRAAAGEPYELQAADGTWVLVADSRLPDGGVISTFTDHSKTKQAEQELRDSEARFRSLIEQIKQGVLVHRHDTMLFVNQALADILGYDSPADLLAQVTVDSFVHPEDRERARSYRFARMRGDPAPLEVEVRVVRKGGGEAWLIAHPVMIEWDGEPAILVAYMDVSERHRAEEALRASERRFQDFSESGSDWFWETGPDQRFTKIRGGGGKPSNDDVQKNIGMTRWEAAGPTVVAADPYEWADHLQILERREPFRNFVYHSNIPGAEPLWLRVSGVPVFEGDGTFVGYRGYGVGCHRRSRYPIGAGRGGVAVSRGVRSSGGGHRCHDAAGPVPGGQSQAL